MNLRKSTSLLVLGFSSGLPLNLVSKTFQAWMTHEKVDLTRIGLFALAMTPYSLKFLWAPFLDEFSLPWLGHRRGWILLCQLLLAGFLAVLAVQDPGVALAPVAMALVVVAFCSATQDIAFDAWRVEQLEPDEKGPGAALGVLGYRIALLATGSLGLVMADRIGWKGVYFAMAGIQAALALATFSAPERPRPRMPSAGPIDLVVEPFVSFFRSRGFVVAATSLGFVVFFKWGVYLVQSVSTPFLLAKGYTQTETGIALGGAGMFATLLGTAAGGALMAFVPVRRALVGFGILQGASGLLFWRVAHLEHDIFWMTSAVVGENFCVGMGSAALVAWLLGICESRHAATQFALLSGLMAFGRDLLTSPSGWIAKTVGWPHFFELTLLACLPGLFLVGWATREAKPMERTTSGA